MSYSNLMRVIKEASLLYAKNKALITSYRVFTYKDLFEKAQHWALLLLKMSNKKKLERVAIFSSRDETSYIATISALMTGASFVPINPDMPSNRNAFILGQCSVDAIITTTKHLDKLNDISTLVILPNIVLFTDNIIKDNSYNEEDCLTVSQDININIMRTSPFDDAYILFTSGSTGKPKGVPIKHASVCRFIEYNQIKYNITPEDRLSQTFEPTFDLSVFDMFMAWCHGACIYAMKKIDLISPIKYINENNLTIWFSVPSVITLLRKQNFIKDGIFPSLRLSLFCGEALSVQNMVAWANAAPNSLCENLYGPTELTISCSSYQWQRCRNNIIHNNIISIGKIYSFLNFIIVDEQDNIISDKRVGELCIGGELYFDGYLNLAETSKCFLIKKDSYGIINKYYKTGDMVMLDDSENLLFHGRKDSQIKINGYRIDLSEIEAAILRLKHVEQSYVFSVDKQHSDGSGYKKIVAYVSGEISSERIKNELAKNLPYYMIPTQIIVENNIPLNINGKINIQLLRKEIIEDKFLYDI